MKNAKRPFSVYNRTSLEESLLQSFFGQLRDNVGKRVYVDFLLVLIELFSLGVTAEALRAHIG